MESFITGILMHSRGLAAYALVFAVLLACGLGLPLPEDVSLLLGGFLSRIGAASLPVMIGVGFLGILSGDSIIYSAGRRFRSGTGNAGGFFAHLVTPDKRARVDRLFQLHGQKIVMIARFLPGLRAVTYFTAGSAGMPYWRFIAWDALAALLSAPLFVYLGFRFANHLRWIIVRVQQGEKAFILGLLLVVVLYVVQLRYRRARTGGAHGARASEDGRPPVTKEPGKPGGDSSSKAPAEWAK